MEGTQGAREIREAVIIAALSALATGLINWAMERAKDAEKSRRERAAKAPGATGR